MAPACLTLLDPLAGQHVCALDAVESKRYLFAGNGRFYLRLKPLAGIGNGPGPAQIIINYAEIGIDYRWPGL